MAIEESYAVVEWVAERGAEKGLNPLRIAVAGDSVGGNTIAALTLMAEQRSGPQITTQVLFYGPYRSPEHRDARGRRVAWPTACGDPP